MGGNWVHSIRSLTPTSHKSVPASHTTGTIPVPNASRYYSIVTAPTQYPRLYLLVPSSYQDKVSDLPTSSRILLTLDEHLPHL